MMTTTSTIKQGTTRPAGDYRFAASALVPVAVKLRQWPTDIKRERSDGAGGSRPSDAP